MNGRVASRVVKGLKTYNITKLENFKKVTENLGIDGKSEGGTQKPNFDNCCEKSKNSEKMPKIRCKNFKETSILPNLVNFSTRFCPCLSKICFPF